MALIGSQYGFAAPPSGSTASVRPPAAIASMSTTLLRSWTYGRMKSSSCVVGALTAAVAAIRRRVVRGRDHDSVREVPFAAAVVNEDGPGDDGRRRDAGVPLNDGLDAVRRQHFEGGALGRFGQGVRVLSHVERAVDRLTAAVVADALRDRQNVGLGERAEER